jgi:chemotaxis protein MotB
MSEDESPFAEKPPVEKPLSGESSAEKPFTEFATKGGRGAASARRGWIAAGVMTALLIAALLLWASALGKLGGMEVLRSKLDQAKSSLTSAQAENQKVKGQIAALQQQVADLETEKEMVGQRAKGLEDEMRSDLESRDVTISNLQGRLTVNILDRVMFNSGEAVVKPDGEAVLRKIASLLAGHPELKIHVIGHTDNVPIRGRFASNWELSTARALAAVHFLTEKAGVDPRRVGAVGYGEYRPIADNSTAEGRARNRRIAITILPDELAGADTVPTVKTNAAAPACRAARGRTNREIDHPVAAVYDRRSRQLTCAGTDCEIGIGAALRASGINSVFNSTEQVLDFARAHFRPGVVQRDRAAQAELGRGQPLPGILFGLHDLDCLAHEPGDPHDAVRFGGSEPSAGLPAMERGLGNR